MQVLIENLMAIKCMSKSILKGLSNMYLREYYIVSGIYIAFILYLYSGCRHCYYQLENLC